MNREKRKKARYESEEPSFDEYVFCASCGDYVYEYCSIHGPLLVIPDDEVPSPTGYPSCVPRAALNIPRVFLHLAPSTIPDAGIGVFSTLTLPRGVRFGPYRGMRTDGANSAYCWQIFDREHRPSHVLDARDATKSNWMRYVNCSRHFREQNLVAFQYRDQLYYRTIRTIPRFTELLVFYGSEFAAQLNIDLRRYHSPVHTETFVNFVDGTLDDATQMTEAPTVNINELRNLKTEEFTPILDESQDQHPSESNSSIINLRDSEEQWETAEFESRDQHQQSCGTQSMIFNLDLKNENVDSNEPQDTHEYDNSNQSLDEKTVHGSQATGTIKKSSRMYQYVCLICNVKFNSKSDHINHDIKMHNSNIKYYACTICDHKTRKRYNLKRHIERHSYLKQKCPLSVFEAAPSSTLKKDAKNHTPANDRNINVDKPHACTTCGNKYPTSTILKRHMRNHSRERKHMCTICKKRFLENCALKRHMKSHDQEKPHGCIVCHMRFCKSSSLKGHMIVHTKFTQNS